MRNKGTIKSAGTWKVPTGKILEVSEGLWGGTEKPRDGPVDEAVIKHQIEITS